MRPTPPRLRIELGLDVRAGELAARAVERLAHFAGGVDQCVAGERDPGGLAEYLGIRPAARDPMADELDHMVVPLLAGPDLGQRGGGRDQPGDGGSDRGRSLRRSGLSERPDVGGGRGFGALQQVSSGRREGLGDLAEGIWLAVGKRH